MGQEGWRRVGVGDPRLKWEPRRVGVPKSRKRWGPRRSGGSEGWGLRRVGATKGWEAKPRKGGGPR